MLNDLQQLSGADLIRLVLWSFALGFALLGAHAGYSVRGTWWAALLAAGIFAAVYFAALYLLARLA